MRPSLRCQIWLNNGSHIYHFCENYYLAWRDNLWRKWPGSSESKFLVFNFSSPELFPGLIHTSVCSKVSRLIRVSLNFSSNRFQTFWIRSCLFYKFWWCIESSVTSLTHRLSKYHQHDVTHLKEVTSSPTPKYIYNLTRHQATLSPQLFFNHSLSFYPSRKPSLVSLINIPSFPCSSRENKRDVTTTKDPS